MSGEAAHGAPVVARDGPSLIVEDVVAGYRGAPTVLHGISLTVASGEIVAVLGRNGAGKTTLLRAISGVLRCREGRIALGGVDLTGMPAHRVATSGVAHVPEGRRVIPDMSVIDNLRLGGYPLRKRAEVEDQLGRILKTFTALAKWQRRVAGSLSGGEQQLLSIARALMGRPSVVLLDEPLTGLAPIFRSEVMLAVERMRSMGQAILLVEQNVTETLPLVDRALVMHEGRITLSGEGLELAGDPALRERYLGVPLTPAGGGA